MEELDRTKTALAATIQEKEGIAANYRSKETLKQDEELSQQQKDLLTVTEEKSVAKTTNEVKKDLTKLEQQGEEADVCTMEHTEQTGKEQAEQVTSKSSIETSTPEKISSSKLPPHRVVSANIPTGKKPATQKQFTSPPKHTTPRSMANLQSEFQQAGVEIDDVFDSDENLNTFSELPREEAECTSATSLEDSLLGSESFLSLDNYNKDIGSQKQKSSKVGSAKEKDRKHSQENEAHVKEHKLLQEGGSQPKEPMVIATAASLTSQTVGEVHQKPAASPSTGILQISETINVVEPSSSNFDVVKNKGVDSSVDTNTAKKSDALSVQEKASSGDDSSESDSSDDEDVVISKGVNVCVSVYACVCVCVRIVCLCVCVIHTYIRVCVYIFFIMFTKWQLLCTMSHSLAQHLPIRLYQRK